ncbi:MAG: hypothetical protein AAFO07_28445 [Bacteroidota bacterium]
MRQFATNLLFFSLFITQMGCGLITGEEVARLSINQVGPNPVEVSIELKKDEEIYVWSNMDMEFEGILKMEFQMEILKNGAPLGNITIDPTDRTKLTLNKLRTSNGNKTSLSFSRKNAQINIPEDGTYTFKAYLESRTTNLKIDKAELVLRR